MVVPIWRPSDVDTRHCILKQNYCTLPVQNVAHTSKLCSKVSQMACRDCSVCNLSLWVTVQFSVRNEGISLCWTLQILEVAKRCTVYLFLRVPVISDYSSSKSGLNYHANSYGMLCELCLCSGCCSFFGVQLICWSALHIPYLYWYAQSFHDSSSGDNMLLMHTHA